MATDRSLFYLSALLITIGIVFSYSLTTYVTSYLGRGEFFFLMRQLSVGMVSIFLMWYISRLDVDIYFSRIGFIIFGVFLFLMTTMHFLPESLVSSVGGAKRWIKFPGLSIAPVEFFKIGFVFFLAWSFSRKIVTDTVRTLKEEFFIFIPYMLAFAVVVYLIAIMQNDLGQVVVLGLTLALMAFMAGTSTKFFMLSSFGAIAIFVVAIVTSDHRILRIKLWWSNIQNFILSFLPDSLAEKLRVHDSVEPYQISNSFYAIKNGGIFGTGLGNGTIKLGFLTEVHTDFVMAGMTEEIGIVGVIGVIGIFFFLILRILKIASRLEDKMHSLFVLGIGLIIALSFFINTFGITGITPIKGIAVPFLSYGGSSLLAHSIAIGMVLMLSKKVKKI